MHKLIVLAGPSAIGKSHTAQMLVKQFGENFAYAKVYTTREKRVVENRSSERVFVTDEAFQKLFEDDVFFAYESFAGYMYGYPRASLNPTDKNLIIDISPHLLPDILHHESIVAVGLQAPDNYWELSEARMIERGDSPTIRAARRPFIEQDIQMLRTLEKLINQHGKLFQVHDNRTIPDQVVPWVLEYLGL